MPNLISLKLFTSLVFSLAHNLAIQPSTAEGLGWKSDNNLFQSDSISKISNQFMKNLNNDNPSTQTVLTFDDCGQTSDAVTIESFEVDPNPPEPGQKLTIRASGTVHELIDQGAYVNVVVKLGAYIKLIQKRFDICEELTKANATLQCPIEPGYYEIVQEVKLPKEIPHAKYKVEARAFTQDEDDMVCADIVLDFLKS
ncbi:hypothetical protein PTTG_05750 [Puccinia triticina 1-1 BBBD Race 1]|uniref:Phosphatidylglycerol/phosphatidylinositol transfer protein n=1 Tax=Puccinia triticina (isolate 1-1 / race 1 (BBBD)) TaxID=630390 RepID=A0A180GP81_PUCT1|nr:hypothetical protein PTTG_05750 [Puccinia triticina 1-1 BBBD Race 1]